MQEFEQKKKKQTLDRPINTSIHEVYGLLTTQVSWKRDYRMIIYLNEQNI